MIEPKKHTIHFQVKNHINWSERIYIKGKIPELGNMDPGYAVPLNVMDEQYWSAEVRINPDQQTESDTIEYEYFIASFDDPLQNVREFQVRIKREFSLSALKERYMHIRDEWNVEGDFPSRVKIFDPKDRVFLNFQIKREIYYGEAIYIMGPLEALANDQELGRVSAVRTEWHPGHVWKGTFDIGLDQIFALNGHLNFFSEMCFAVFVHFQACAYHEFGINFLYLKEFIQFSEYLLFKFISKVVQCPTFRKLQNLDP